MKKVSLALLALVLALSLCACEGIDGAKIDYGTSEKYSEEEIKSAADTVLEKFLSFDGCKLYDLTYMGDEKSDEQLEYARSLSKDTDYDECVIFTSSFRTPIFSSGAWNPNDVMTNWTWLLARTDGGVWELVTYGQA